MAPAEIEEETGIRCRLDALLTERGMTLTRLSELVGVSVVNLSVLKNNRGKAIDEWSTYIRMDCCSEFSNTVAKKRIKALQDAAAGD